MVWAMASEVVGVVVVGLEAVVVLLEVFKVLINLFIVVIIVILLLDFKYMYICI